MNMKRLSLLAVIGALTLALIVPSTVAAAPQRNALLTNVPVAGELEDGGTFTGALSLTNVALNSAGQLVFGGTLTGTATTAGGTVTQIANQAFELVVGALTGGGTQGKCDILFLDLAPIHLDLLGLEVDLSQITLDVNAIPGPGNLLGNLLCAVVGLLDGGPLAGLGALLNRITVLLGGLLG
jgi:hypothetical protein